MGIYNQYNVEVAEHFDSPMSETLMSLVPYVAYPYPRGCLFTGTILYGQTLLISILRVSAPDGTTVDDLRMVKVPPGLMIEILDFDIY